MKTFRAVLKEIIAEQMFHPEKEFPGRAMGIISAHKTDYDDETSRHQHNLLHKDLQDHGFKVEPVDGVYKGGSERSWIAIHPHEGNDHNHTLNTLKSLGKKYGQESILHKAHNSDDAQLHFTNGSKDPSINLGKLHMGGTGDNFSRLKDGRTFTFEGEKSNET